MKKWQNFWRGEFGSTSPRPPLVPKKDQSLMGTQRLDLTSWFWKVSRSGDPFSLQIGETRGAEGLGIAFHLQGPRKTFWNDRLTLLYSARLMSPVFSYTARGRLTKIRVP